MNKKIETLGRLVSLIIGIMGVVIGFAFGFSLGQINLIPIPDLRHANPLSGLVIGTICILTVIVEGGYFYLEYLPAINHKKPFEKANLSSFQFYYQTKGVIANNLKEVITRVSGEKVWVLEGSLAAYCLVYYQLF